VAERIEQIQERMAHEGLDALVLRLAENVLLATGYYVQIGGLAIAVIPRDGTPALMVPEYEGPGAAEVEVEVEVRTFAAIRFDAPPPGPAIEAHLRELIEAAGGTGGRVAYEGSFEAVAPPVLAGEPNAVALPTANLIRAASDGAELVDFTASLEEIRSIKTERDIERLTVVNEVAMIGLEAFKKYARPGITEVALAAEVEAAILRDGSGHRGARVVRGWATITSGPATADGWKYFISSTRTIERDDVVIIELGTVADGYWADHTRTVVAGTATPEQKAAFDAMRGGLAASFDAARPGVTGDAADAASREAVRAAGFEQFPHHTGHGTGFRYHESRPAITAGSEAVIEAGMVIACEPGIYEERIGGFRWEDDAVITADGARPLATSEYELD